jgi:hypothetical protein
MGKQLLPPMSGVNDKGFFEDEEFLDMHIQLVHSHKDPQILFPPPSDGCLESYKKLIASREQEHQLWGIKDPKMCFLLPYFLQRLNHEPRIVVTSRPFYESVTSMRPLYGGLTLDQSVTLLARYLYSLEKNLAGLQCRQQIINFTSLLNNTAVCLEALGNLLDIRITEEHRQQAMEFIDPKLKRH